MSEKVVGHFRKKNSHIFIKYETTNDNFWIEFEKEGVRTKSESVETEDELFFYLIKRIFKHTKQSNSNQL